MKILFLLPLIISLENLVAKEVLNIHIIPHSHQDPGWLTTIEGYYTGHSSPFGECVKCMIERIMKLLKENSTYIFTWAELAFLKIWFDNASVEDKELFGSFLQNGQIDFVNGGYVTNDEACTYYEDIIEQLVWGNRFLFENYHYIPTVAWHIDPFGHSATTASIFSQAGFEAFFFERSNEIEISSWKEGGSLEYIWDPAERGDYIFSHYNYLKYGGLDATGYCVHTVCNYFVRNIRRMADWFIEQRKAYPSRVMLLQIGKDFSFGYSNDNGMYKEILDIIPVLNGVEDMDYIFNATVSTPGRYSKDFFDEYDRNKSINLKIRTKDNFPYIENIGWGYRYWTGYFSSRPHVKLIAKESSLLLQNYRKLFSKWMLQANTEGYFVDENNTFTFDTFNEQLDRFEQAVALIQHHDGVSGTAKSWVERDYIDKLFGPRIRMNRIISNKFQKEHNSSSEFLHCPQNHSFYEICNETLTVKPEGSLLVRIFNPAKSGKILVRFKIPNAHYSLDTTGLLSNLAECWEIYCTSSLYNENDDCQMVFYDNLSHGEEKAYPLIYSKDSKALERNKNFDISSRIEVSNTSSLKIKDLNPITISYMFCPITEECQEEEFNFDIGYFIANYDSAYIAAFLNAYPKIDSQYSQVEIVKGKLLTIIQFRDFRASSNEIRPKLILRNEELEKGFELVTQLSPIALAGTPSGREYMLNIRTDINNSREFTTDSNGLLIIPRKVKDIKTPQESIYPVNSQISISSSEKILTLMNDRSQGGIALQEGELNLMIHRRVMSTGQGIGEYLDDTEPIGNDPLKVETTHRILISRKKDRHATKVREKQLEDETALLIFYSSFSSVNDNGVFPFVYNEELEKCDCGLVKYSIRPYKKNEIMMRLVNLDEQKPKDFQLHRKILGSSINTILSSLSSRIVTILSINEVAINTVTRIEDKFNKMRKFREIKEREYIPRSTDIVEMGNLEIRTFIIEIGKVYPSNDGLREALLENEKPGL